MASPSLRFQLTSPLSLLMVVVLMAPALIAAGPPKRPPTKVAVAPVTRMTLADQTTLMGTVQPFQASTVASLTEGRVTDLKVRTGDRVIKGAALALLDTTQLTIDSEQVAARVAATRIRLAQAEADLATARSLLAQQAVSSELVDTRARTVREMTAQVTRDEAEEKQLIYQIEEATIRAPFDGVVSKELTQPGEWVARGGAILRLVDLSPARVVVWVPEDVVGRLKVGTDTVVNTPVGPQNGTLHAIIPDGDPGSHTFPVEVRLPNRDGRLFSGMLARVTFSVGEAKAVLTVPRDAVVTRGHDSHLWKVVDGHAVRVPLRMGSAAGERIAVQPFAELAPGDPVIVRGNERVRDGQSVAVAP